MALINRSLAPTGELSIKVIRAPKAPLAWRVKNAARPSFLKGWIAYHLIRPIARAFGLMTAIATLELTVIKRSGERVHYGVVSYRVVTDAFVAQVVDDLDNSAADISGHNFHGIGTGSTAEAAGDTALVTEITTEYLSNNTRPSGTRSQPAANQYRTVGTVEVDASVAAVEHGVFDNATVGSGTLMDRSVFTVVNLDPGDSLQATYTLTLTSGA